MTGDDCSLKYFDCHCDTLTEMYSKNKGFYHNGLDCDRALLSPVDEAHVVYAIYNSGKYLRSDMINIINYFYSHLNEITNGKAYISIEGLGNQPDFSIDDVCLYRSLGVRMMSLTWNNDNILSGGIGENKSGLTNMGKKVIAEMEREGVIADVSHISDAGFFDIIELIKMPVCASHSNSRYICENPRNLTDEQFKLIVQSGGVAGINLYAPFLSCGRAVIDDALRHIEHFLNLGGEHSIGIGTDFDGIDLKPAGIENCGDLCRLYELLLAKGYSESFINSLFFDNFSQLFKKYEF